MDLLGEFLNKSCENHSEAFLTRTQTTMELGWFEPIVLESQFRDFSRSYEDFSSSAGIPPKVIILPHGRAKECLRSVLIGYRSASQFSHLYRRVVVFCPWNQGGIARFCPSKPRSVPLCSAKIAIDAKYLDTFTVPTVVDEFETWKSPALLLHLPWIQTFFPNASLSVFMCGTDVAIADSNPAISEFEKSTDVLWIVLQNLDSDVSNLPSWKDVWNRDAETLSDWTTGSFKKIRHGPLALLSRIWIKDRMWGAIQFYETSVHRAPLVEKVLKVPIIDRSLLPSLRRYGSVALWDLPYTEFLQEVSPSAWQKNVWIDHAKDSIGRVFAPDFPAIDPLSPGFLRDAISNSIQHGLFVGIYDGKELRGSVGNIQGVGSVWDTIRSFARLSAFSDPRFKSVTGEEWIDGRRRYRVNISLLRTFQMVSWNPHDEKQYRRWLGKATFLVKKKQGGRSAVILDRIPEEEGWSLAVLRRDLLSKAQLKESDGLDWFAIPSSTLEATLIE
jgi:AMMECR1 domain-containing protein